MNTNRTSSSCTTTTTKGGYYDTSTGAIYNAGRTLTKEEVQKKEVLIELRQKHIDRRANKVQNNPKVMDIDTQIDENNLRALKLLQANELLREARKNFAEEIEKEYDEVNSYDNSELQNLLGQEYPPSFNGFVQGGGTITTTGTITGVYPLCTLTSTK